MKKVYFLKMVLFVFAYCSESNSKGLLFESYSAQARKMLNSKTVLQIILKEVNLPFLADFQTHITALEQFTKLSQVSDLKKQLELVENSQGEAQALALQKAVADFQTLLPLTEYLFKEDSLGNGLVTKAVRSMRQATLANSLAKMAQSIDLVAEICMLLVNAHDLKDSTSIQQNTGAVKVLTKVEQKQKEIADKLAAKNVLVNQKISDIKAKVVLKKDYLNAKLYEGNLVIDPETREAAKNLRLKITDENVWKKKADTIHVSSNKEKIQLGIKAVQKMPLLVNSFNKLKFDALIDQSKKVTLGQITYRNSNVTSLLKEISEGLSEFMGEKDSFVILVLRVIGTPQALSLAHRFITTSKTITGFMTKMADSVLLSQIMKSLPAKNVAIPVAIEEWPTVESELDFS